MADLREILNRISNVRKNIDSRLRPEFESLEREVDGGAGLTQVQSRVEALRRGLAAAFTVVSNQIAILPQVTGATPNALADTQKQLQQLAIEIEVLQTSSLRLLDQARLNDEERKKIDTTARVSAGDQVSSDKDAQVDGAQTQSPSLPDESTESSRTNATTSATSSTAGLPASGAPANESTPEQARRTRTTQAGASATTDDAYSNQQENIGISSNAGEVAIAPEFLKPIIPTENLLNNLTTSTYSLSIYVMSPPEYRDLIAQKTKQLPNSQLLVQSGGAPNGQRNRYFDVDFYIEDLEIESLVGTQEVRNSHNATNLTMKILEPQGITFLQRLKRAALEHSKVSGFGNEFSMTYLLVIRFYGYDENGNQISASQLGSKGFRTDRNAIIEKFIPFHIGNLTYQIQSKATEYTIQAVTPQTNIGYSIARATIPFTLGLQGETVSDMLGNRQGSAGRVSVIDGDYEVTEEEIDQNNITTPVGTVYKGSLVGALNKYQSELVKTGRYTYPDIYNIIFEDAEGLADAQLAKPGRPNKNQSVLSEAETAADRFLSSKLNYNGKARTWTVQAGTQIVQLIDLMMRSSTYITKQQNVIIDEKTGKVSASAPDVDVVQWYRVRCTVEPLQYDAKRNDYQYEITYIISRYKINTPLVAGFPKTRYVGTHKLYNYWFTGENSEVIDFSINVNANYLTPINQAGLSASNQEVEDPGPFPNKKVYAVPNASQQGGTRNSLIIAAGLADRLYNPVDVAYSDVEILGDPDWIQQSEVYYGSKTKINLNAFMYDGSVNYESGEVLYEIKFNPINDYNTDNGLVIPFRDQPGIQTPDGTLTQGQENLIFSAVKVTNYFRNGAFTQRLSGHSRHFRGAIGNPDTVNDDEFNDTGLPFGQSNLQASPSEIPSGSSTLTAVPTPTQRRRLQSTGNTSNTNIDTSLPFRDVEINGTLTRVYGTSADLLQYYGDQGVQPKPGSTVISDDAGDAVLKN